MGVRIFFRGGKIIVTAVELKCGRKVYPLAEVVQARTQRTRPAWCPFPITWLDRYSVILTMQDGTELAPLWHRNGYFAYQLVFAIQAAIAGRSAKQTTEARIPNGRWAGSFATRERTATENIGAQQVATALENSSA